MIRLIAIGDVHFRQDDRQPLRLAALDQIIDDLGVIDEVSDNPIGAVLIPGDLFDAKSTPADRNELADRLQRLAYYAPVVLTYGNHDVAGDLDIFESLRGEHPITVVRRPEVIRVQLRGLNAPGLAIAVMPYPHKGGLVGAGVAHGDLVQTAADLLDPIYMQLAAEMEAEEARGSMTLYMGHHAVTGARMSSGQPAIGREIEVSQAHLDRLGRRLKVLSHIHLPQEIGGAIYTGSIAPMDWGETHDCRYLVIEMRSSLDYAVESRPIRQPRLYHLEGDLTREGFMFAEDFPDADVLGRFGMGDWSGCEVRVRYRYRASERAALDEQVIRTLFASAQRLKIESVVIPDRELRAPAVAAARTLADKLAAMREDGSLPAGVAGKLAALEQHDPEQVLTDVRAALAAIEGAEKVEAAA